MPDRLARALDALTRSASFVWLVVCFLAWCVVMVATGIVRLSIRMGG